MANTFDKKTTSVNNTLLQAVEEVSKNVMAQYKYDRTEICKIVDDTKANEGTYIVDLDGITFEAFGDINKYKKDQSVRVNVSNSDYTDRKFIIGLYEYNNEKNLYYNISGKNLVPLYSCRIIEEKTTVSYTMYATITNATVYKITFSVDGGYNDDDLVLLSSPNSDYGQLDIIMGDSSTIYLLNYYPDHFKNFPDFAQIDLYIGGKKAKVTGKLRLGKIIEIHNVPLSVSGEKPTSFTLNGREMDVNKYIGYKDSMTLLLYRSDYEIFKDAVTWGNIAFDTNGPYDIGEYTWTKAKEFNKSTKELFFIDDSIKDKNIDINIDKDGITLFKDLLLSFEIAGYIHSDDEILLYLKTQDNFTITEHPLIIKGSMLFGASLLEVDEQGEITNINNNYKYYEFPAKLTQVIQIPQYIKGKLLSITGYVKCNLRTGNETNFSFTINNPECKIGYSILNQTKKLHIWTDDEKLAWKNKEISMNMVWLNQNEKNQYIGFSDGNTDPFDYVNTFSSYLEINNGYGTLNGALPSEFQKQKGIIEFGYWLIWSATGKDMNFKIPKETVYYNHFKEILQGQTTKQAIIVCYQNYSVVCEKEVVLSSINIADDETITFSMICPDEVIDNISFTSFAFFGDFSVFYEYSYNKETDDLLVYTGDYDSSSIIYGYAKFNFPYYYYDEQEYLKQYQDAETLNSYIQQVQNPDESDKIDIKILSTDSDENKYTIPKNDAALRFCLGFQTLLERTGINASKAQGSKDGKLIDQYFYIMYLLKNRPNQNVILETERRIQGGEIIPQLIQLFGIWSDIVYNINGVRDYINDNKNRHISEFFKHTLQHYEGGSSLLNQFYINIKNILNEQIFPDLDIYSQSGIKEINDNSNILDKYYLNSYWSIRECLIQSSKILNLIRVYTRVFSKVDDLITYQEVHPLIEKYLLALNETIKITDQLWQIEEINSGYKKDYNIDEEWEEYTPEIRYIEQYNKLRFLNNSEKYTIVSEPNSNGDIIQRSKSYYSGIGGELTDEYIIKGESGTKIQINQFIKELFGEIAFKGVEFSNINNEDRDKYVISYKVLINDQDIIKLTYLDIDFQEDNLENPIYITCPKNFTVKSGTAVDIGIYQKNFSPLQITPIYELVKNEEVNENIFYPGYYELIMNQATEGKDSYVLPYLYTDEVNVEVDDTTITTYSKYQFDYLDDWMQRIGSTLRHCRFLVKFNKKEVINNIFLRYLDEYNNGMEGNYEIKDLVNRYSLQWYLFNEDGEEDQGEGKGWEKISTISTLSQNSLDLGQEQFFEVLKYKFQDNNAHKIKAVLYYNHERYESNIIELQSYQDYINELNAAMNIDKQLVESVIEVPSSGTTTYGLTRTSATETVEVSNEKITFQKANQNGQMVSSIAANEIYLINDEGLKTPLTDYLDGAGYSGGSVTVETTTDLPSAEANTTGF